MTLNVPLQDHPVFENYPHRPNTKVTITINRPGYESIRDTEGNFAKEYTLNFWIEGPTRVFSTVPAGGSTDVSPTADLVSITFIKPMNTAYKSESRSNWWCFPATNCWSEDAMTLCLPLQDIHYPFRPNTLVRITINERKAAYEFVRDTS